MRRAAKVARHIVGDGSMVAQLSELAQLFRDGMLTAPEFSEAKQQLLHPHSSAHARQLAPAAAVVSDGSVALEPDPIVAVPGGINRSSDYEPGDAWLAVVHDNFKAPELWKGAMYAMSRVQNRDTNSPMVSDSSGAPVLRFGTAHCDAPNCRTGTPTPL
eukprot:SAG31_NODE_212_length_20157_cov_9.648868_20_plen_159_part_00